MVRREGQRKLLKFCDEHVREYRDMPGVEIEEITKRFYDCKTMSKDMMLKFLGDEEIRRLTGGNIVVMVTHVDKFYFHFPEFMRASVVKGMPSSAEDMTYRIAGQLPGYVYYRVQSSDMTVGNCLDLFNEFMEVPIIVQAYGKACRCVSFRNRLRCPSAEVALIGKDRNWGDTFQAIARGNGNNQATLRENGCPHF